MAKRRQPAVSYWEFLPPIPSDERPATIEEAYQRARETGEPPICPYCGRHIVKIQSVQRTFIEWVWENGKWVKDDSGGDASKPYPTCCETPDWDFVDFEWVYY